jgi:hypothetical protein
MDLNAVASGIAANVATITDLNTLDFGPDDGTDPLFWVGSIEEQFDTAMGRGQDELSVTCWLIASRADDESGQTEVRRYMSGSGTKSIRTAIRTDKTLGGSASDVRAVSARGPIPIELGSNRFIGAQFTLQVIGRGNA